MISLRLLSTRSIALLRREDGSSLLLALILLAAFSVSTAGLVQFSRANEFGSGRERQATRSFSIAESGLHYGIAAVVNRDPSDALAVSSTVSSTSVSVDGGTATYSATKTAAGLWTVYSTGVSPNGAVTRQLSIQVGAGGTQASAWNWGFAIFPASGCVTTSGASKINVSVYVTTDFCPSGSSGVAQPSGTSGTLDVYIGGQFKPSGSASIGESLLGVVTPVRSTVVVGGCPSATGGSCSASNSAIYTNSLAGSGTTMTKPTVNADTVYASGNWSTPTCSVGSFTFDTNTTRNSSIGTADIFGSSTFDCTVTNSSGTTVGRLAWNSTTKVMTISGLIFIDTAKLNTSSKDATYTGKGSIYSNGTIVFSSSNLCGPPATLVSGACSGTWNPATGNLTLVALNSANQGKAIDLSGGSVIDASAYANGLVNLSGGTQLSGPVIADGAVLSGGSRSVAPYTQPASSPGAAAGYAPVRGSWRQIQ